MRDGEEISDKDREKEIKAGADKSTRETRIARAALDIRYLREASKAGHLDPKESATVRDRFAWLSSEELDEAERRADQGDAPVDPHAMSDDLMDRLREQIDGLEEKK